MDLNQVPNDQMLNGVNFGEIKLGNFNGVVGLDSKIESLNGEKNLALELEIRNKDLELKGIDDRIRVLGGENLRIGDEIKGLKDKDKDKNFDFRGSKIGFEMVCGEGGEGDEGSRVDEVMVENKVLECEKLRVEGAIKGLESDSKDKDLDFRGLKFGGDEVSRVDELMVENKVLECEKLRVEGEIKGLKNESKDKDLDFRGLEIGCDEVSRVDEVMVENGVLECEKLRVEDEIEGLKNENKDKDLDFRGSKIGDEGEELSKIEELMVEIKVLECERNAAIKEVEVWKKKYKELEVLVIELEERLKCQGQDGISVGTKCASPVNDEDVASSKGFGSTCQVPPMDGVMPLQGTCTPDKLDVLPEGTLSNKVYGRRRLAFRNEKRCDVKIAPSSPTSAGVGRGGSRPPSAALIDIIDSDNECDVHADPRTDSQCLVNSCEMSEYGAHETDEIMDEEENNGGRTAPYNTRATKKRRDLMMVMSDNESADHKYMPRRRKFKVENSDNEGEYDDNNHDTTPVRQLLNEGTIVSESDDDEDNIPISQLKRKRDQGSSRPRRHLVKHGKGDHEDVTHELGDHPDNFKASENVGYEMSSDEDSANSDRSLRSFIVSDSDVEDVEDDVSKDPEDDVLEDLEDNSGELEETSDSDMDFGEMISKLGSRRDPNSEWIGEGDMLADFGKSPELCMKAVCALYRQQTIEEQKCKESLFRNGRGFSKYDAMRGTYLGDFLTNGDPNGDLVKSVEELQQFDSKGLEDCHKFAKHYSKQLFNIYESGEDPFFL